MRQAITNINLPGIHESELAQRGRQEMAAYLSTKFETQRISIVGEDEKMHTIELPTSALTMLMEVLGELAAGNAVQIVPVQAELTTQEAANMLNVSRPHLVKLLEEGELPFHKTGRHRRVLFADLMEYKKSREQQSLDAMQALADQAQETGMY
ncbi:helix-turn-helix domain-containing protein [Cedecea davisae]|uniref:Helix-turn-helix domain-containing protein n=1 Tax=Cedecea davisae TaxID=158484 RepID=A0ABS6DFY6_9ENTR|nr:helix-turn-helix domain-containing protein [Cedecea davisae]MBU4682116.1 helix-turn-helix domain-containing protein [Cedecea davisae]MBU4687149.1 helix-turn-helix domain-containing protein [Cedecea davisae]